MKSSQLLRVEYEIEAHSCGSKQYSSSEFFSDTMFNRKVLTAEGVRANKISPDNCGHEIYTIFLNQEAKDQKMG